MGLIKMKINSNFYKVTQVKRNLWAIEDIISSEHTVCYLICGTDKALLFDTGLGVSPVSPIVKVITDLPVQVILSHWHFDHCGAANEFDDIIGWSSREMINISRKGANKDSIDKLVGADFFKSINREALEVKAFPQIRLIDSEEVIDIGGYIFMIIHTPGHTKDSICLYEATRKWLLTGDTVYPGPLYLHFNDSSIKNYSSSIKKLLNYDVHDIFPGHNQVIVGADILGAIKIMTVNHVYESATYPSLKIVNQN